MNPVIKIFFILFGILLGILFFFQPIFLFIIALYLGTLLFISKVYANSRFLIMIVTAALCLRLGMCGIAVIVSYLSAHPTAHLYGKTMSMVRDFHRENINGVKLSHYFAGEFGNVPLSQVSIHVAHGGITSFLNMGTYVQAFLHYILGKSNFNFFIYALIGTWIIIIGYHLARELFNPMVASITAIILTFAPSFIIWSAIALRITLTSLGILLMGLALVQFGKSKRFLHVLLLSIGLLFVFLAKKKFFQIFFPLALFLLFLNNSWKWSIKLSCILIALISFYTYPPFYQKVTFQIKEVRSNLIANHAGFFEGYTGNRYKLYNDAIYNRIINKKEKIMPSFLDFAKVLPKGISHFLFSPFPWTIDNTLKLIVYPLVLIWYILLIFFILGLWIGLRIKTKETLTLLMLMVPLIIVLSLALANEGTAVRHRNLFSHIVYIFSAAGVYYCLEYFDPKKNYL